MRGKAVVVPIPSTLPTLRVLYNVMELRGGFRGQESGKIGGGIKGWRGEGGSRFFIAPLIQRVGMPQAGCVLAGLGS